MRRGRPFSLSGGPRPRGDLVALVEIERDAALL